MAGQRVYLDYNATAPLRAGARAAACAAMDLCGNPSSVHFEGRAARAAVDKARDEVAALAGVPAGQVTFVSGATEAANLALTPQVRRPGGEVCDVLIIAGGEHACVMDGHRFSSQRVHMAALDKAGALDLAALEGILDDLGEKPCMLALQAANNETGVVQPVAVATQMVHAKGGLLVCDAAQAIHRLPKETWQGADIVFFSSHKIGGPKGAGALALVNPALEIVSPLMRGGGQERGLRAGTENVAAIAGFGAAAREVAGEGAGATARQRGLRDAFEAGLRARFADVEIFGEKAQRLANTSAFAIPGFTAETMLIALDLEGVSVSSGSACSSGKVKSSHVLENMRVAPDLARCALRVSFGPGNAQEDVARALGALEAMTQRIAARRLKPAA